MTFSADCKAANSQLDIGITSSQLPVKDGEEISYTCPENYIKPKENEARAVCQDGIITISPEGASPCSKTGIKCAALTQLDDTEVTVIFA